MPLREHDEREKSQLLFVTSSLDIGGTERHLAQVTAALSRRGWPVTVFCFNSRGAHAAAVQEAGVQVVGPPVETSLDRMASWRRIAYAALAAGRLSRLISRLHPRVMHFFLAEAYIAGAPLAVLQRVPVRIMSRRSLNQYQTHWPGAARLERWLHPQMTAVLGNSRAIVGDLRDREGCDPAQIGLIYNGVDLATFGQPRDRAAIRAGLGIGADTLVAIKVANLNSYKGHADLIAGLGGIKQRMPPSWLVLLVGRDRGIQAALEAEVRRQGIGANVRFLGARTDVADLLAASDLGVLCSHEEGFSNAIIESMAAGLAMVVTDVGGNPEAVVHGETGIVVPPRSPAALGEAIAALAGDGERRRRLGAAGRKRAETLFTMAGCIDRYEALYLGMLAGKPLADIAEVAIEQ